MPIHYERIDHTALITIDNGKVNVLKPDMHRELRDAVFRMNGDPEIRVGILRGAPGRSFCAGDDIKTPRPVRTKRVELESHLFPRHDAEPDLARRAYEQELMLLRRYKPVIGAVDGYCLGQGMVYLMLLTDLRIATPEAKFGFPEIAYGMGGAGGVTQLGRHMPPTRALWMLLTGESMDAEEALRVDLVNKIVPKERLTDEALAVAEKIARIPAIAVRVELESYYRGMDKSRVDAAIDGAHLYRMQHLGDSTEGILPSFISRTKKP